jgi:hypothetical protein
LTRDKEVHFIPVPLYEQNIAGTILHIFAREILLQTPKNLASM